MSIGVDIVDINRIIKILEKNRDHFYKKIFTYGEIKHIESKKHRGETVAGLFALKEAISKLIGKGIGEINWKDLEILHYESGKPYLNLNEKLEDCMRELKIKNIEVSISHEKNYAIALAVGYPENTLDNLDNIVIDKSFLDILPERKNDTHKGDFGRALIVGGSKGMTGSMFLSSRACMRTGVGLTYTLVPESLEDIMSIKLTEEIIKTGKSKEGYFTREALEDILEASKNMDAIGIGPGMGNNNTNKYIIGKIIESIDLPIVIDADGINAIGKDLNLFNQKKNEIVITPHPGELARLLEITTEEVQKNRIYYSKYISKKYNIILVLKGHRTIVCYGDEIYINHSGNPGMATAGSGDVLTGIITSLIAQGVKPFYASKLGVYIHGLAGDMAKEKKGEYGMIAGDILDEIPKSIQLILNS